MSSERPAKRVRQACEPCRRKKSRCPGEKPVCSYCSRLQQNCYYVEDRHEREATLSGGSPAVPHRPPASVADSTLEDRLRLVENQLFALTRSPSVPAREPYSHTRISPREDISVGGRESNIVSLPHWNIVLAAAQAYLQHCQSQPLPLFNPATLVESLSHRDPELILSIIVVASRFVEATQYDSVSSQQISDFVKTSREQVSQRILDGSIELSTIQTLCLLSFFEFTNGNPRRASIDSSLALSLASNAGLTSEPAETVTLSQSQKMEREERRRCFWSLLVLRRLHGTDFTFININGDDDFPPYPESAANTLEIASAPRKDGPQDTGIVSYVIQLTEVWFKITKYASRRTKANSLPPWSVQSEYSTILADQMDQETRMPFIHRFEPAKFSQRTLEDLNQNRGYWAPWLLSQFLYHTNLCLLNHPLLLSLRLRNFKGVIPEIFLQQTSNFISSNASWIVNLVDMVDAKGFEITDPFLGHCVAIVATIYLQETFVDDVEIRAEKQIKFERCMAFIRKLGLNWPHVQRIAEKLQRLSETVSSTYVVSEEPIRQNRKLLINLGQFFEILEYSSSSEIPGAATQLFGPTLRPRHFRTGTEIAQTSVLPEPTRIERQEFGTPVHRNSLHSSLNTPAGGVGHLYTDDELAVLAESFFHQQPEFEGSLNWWNTDIM